MSPTQSPLFFDTQALLPPEINGRAAPVFPFCHPCCDTAEHSATLCAVPITITKVGERLEVSCGSVTDQLVQ